MPGIYSTQFGLSGDLFVAPIEYVVPAGLTLVLKDIDVFSSVDGLEVLVEVVQGSTVAVVTGFKSSGTFDSWSWRGGLVCPAGAVVLVAAVASGAEGAASGFLLAARP